MRRCGIQVSRYANQHNISNLYVISDSANVLTDIKYYNVDTSPHPYLIHQICHSISDLSTSQITIAWLPGHHNNIFIQSIDTNAKLATLQSIIEPISYSKYEAILLLENWVWERWQKDWSNNVSCTYQQTFSTCRNNLQFALCRKKEVIVNRIRLQQSKLKSGLFKIGQDIDGLCVTCGTVQSNEHFITECDDTKLLRDELYSMINVSKNWKYRDLISNPISLKIIVEYIVKNQVDI
jgi:hypothetical protein